MELTHLDKVVGPDGVPWKPQDGQLYGEHLNSVLRHLAATMGSAFERLRFVVYFHPTHQPFPRFSVAGDDTVLIFLSDEAGTLPQELSSQFLAIFKTYFPLSEKLGNIIPFPIGYSNAHAHLRSVPFGERPIAASFSGNFIHNRLDFYRQFGGLKWMPPFPIYNAAMRKLYWHLLKRTIFAPGKVAGWRTSDSIYFSGGFGTGLSQVEYAAILSDSKIALCPRGFISTECWRLFEAMSIGCVIVSDELPPSRWFRDSPIIQVKNWLTIKEVVDALLADPDRLASLHADTLSWWSRTCEDRAAAEYLAEEMRQLMG